MAKNKTKTKGEKTTSAGAAAETRSYVFAAILLVLFGVIVFLMSTYTSQMSRQYNQNSQLSIEYLSDMQDELRKVNENVLEIIGGVGSTISNVREITISFDAIEDTEKRFEELSYHSNSEMRRYNQAKIFIEAYRQKLAAFQTQLSSGALDTATMRALYAQEIAPLSFSAAEMLESAVALNDVNTITLSKNIIRTGMITTVILIALIVVGEIAIYIAARLAKRRREELEKKTQQAEAAANKFKRSQQKTKDMAYTNMVTDMRNRYGLDEDLSERLETEQFNISLFDMDGFRMINDTYGYDFGDEYLAQISEKLKAEFSQFAQIYNITGNSFAFLFNKEVSDAQAARLSQSILMSLSSVFNVANLNIQLSATGCVYHYLAGEALNLDGILIRMNNVIRNGKRSGGNVLLNADQV
ncbi:MAG: GGDEF domain-containing protein [Ruminococcus sp.]|nr:GGDEF domain-containing protein [Ruminococcus sp.]MBQ5317127.1 GGDEF domain-containing protein [Oscillospiraceae bacterium]